MSKVMLGDNLKRRLQEAAANVQAHQEATEAAKQADEAAVRATMSDVLEIARKTADDLDAIYAEHDATLAPLLNGRPWSYFGGPPQLKALDAALNEYQSSKGFLRTFRELPRHIDALCGPRALWEERDAKFRNWRKHSRDWPEIPQRLTHTLERIATLADEATEKGYFNAR